MPGTADRTGRARSSIGAPVILAAGDELLFFKTAAHLEAYVDPADIANGAYRSCWDAEGRLLTVTIEKSHSSVLGVVSYGQDVVRVKAAEERPSHLSDLHMALLRYLSEVGLNAEMPATNDTSDLLDFAIEQDGWT